MSAFVDLKRGVFLDAPSVDVSDLDFTQLKNQLDDLDLRKVTSRQQLDDALSNVDVVISNKVVLNRETLERYPDIKLICIAATGVNNVDLTAAHELGITVCNVTGYATASVVQHVFSLILALHSRLLEVRNGVANGEWCRSEHFSLLKYPITELTGKTLGIIGYGELGRAVAEIAQAFGMRVLLARRDDMDERSGRLALHDLLPQVDVLSLHCPLTEHTKNLIDQAELKLMKSDAILINAARGGIVNEHALVDALKNQQIAGAGIDVLAVEPPPENHPLLAYKADNLLVTPHVAWASKESRQRLIDQVAENIRSFKQGRPRNLV